MAMCNFNVHGGPFTVTCTGSQTIPLPPGACSAAVGYPAPTTTGTCGTVTCVPASGSSFNLGTTTVTCTSAAGPSCSFTITLTDTQPPTVTCPANIVTNTAPNTCAANVTYTVPTASDNCTGATVTCTPASGSSFPKGTTTVTCTAKDTSNNMAMCTFTVTVNDNQNPTITCPANISIPAAAGQCSAVATYTTPTPTDNCPGATASCMPASGSTFAVGTTTVTCTATDASNNTASCTFTVTVNDTQNPTLTCPSNITTSATTGSCSATVTYTVPTASDNCPGVTVTCTPNTGSSFAVGTTTVTCTATDASNNTASCTFTVTVNDTQNPTVTCPANIVTNTAPNTCAANVTYTTPTASDNCPGATVTCTPASGSSFAKGVTTVTCTAKDASNNMAMCTFTVTVNDNQNPAITCPANISIPAAAGQCSAVATYTTPTPTDNCPGATASCVPASGSTFQKGVTTVTCTATDASNNTASCTFTVTVNDTQNPSITCPANISLNTAPGLCSAVATYTTPTPTDNCPGATAACVPASGSTFQKGVTTVTCTATDASNNTASCTFTVTVTDNQNPTITCPANQTVTSPGGPIVVNYPAPTANDNCPGVTTSCVPPSGSTFQLGTTTVTCTATDAASHTASCSFTVTVITCTSIVCPSDIFVGTTGSSTTVTYSLPTANGNCGTITCTPASGSTFNVGVTTVSCSSSIGNQTCAFRVTVNQVSNSISDPLICTGPGNNVSATLTISNNGNVNQNVVGTTTFTNLIGIPGTCVASIGSCTVTNSAVNYSGTLAPGQTATITYLTQVSDLALPGAQVCTNNSVTFNGGPPLLLSACGTVNCPAPGPGGLYPAASEASDQKAGSVLIYNIYTSNATNANAQNTRVNITNVHAVLPSYVHMFFVAEGCSIADSYICLTGNQTASFLASDLDPGTTGYLVAVAVDALGCPRNFNYLIGDEYVKFSSGHAANLAAESFAAIPGGRPACDQNAVIAMLNFDGVSYNRTPAVLALDSVGARADGNDTLLILNRIGGNLGIGASTLGTLFGVLYDDTEAALSFSVAGNCQLRNSLSNNFPRTTPRFETFIPAGRTGWLKVFNQTGAIGITGAAINFNANATSSAGAFTHGHNLHHLTLNATSSYVIPVFPPSC
ncbi:MAG: HYR domain-containing protein [Acidobacteria bacterium]|nr:HYR domain-containing protein [Acidobacteriota bacterium]